MECSEVIAASHGIREWMITGVRRQVVLVERQIRYNSLALRVLFTVARSIGVQESRRGGHASLY